ncbi:TPA: hypothetical protein I9Y36_000709 [Citrobacter amalonaticus]|nr:hypothetical protein [Citrobacter amalonaticus]
MKLTMLAQPNPILDEEILETIRTGTRVIVQLTDGVSDKFNISIVLRVRDRDEHVLECEFLHRKIGKFDDQSLKYKSPFQEDVVVFIKEAVFDVEND